MFDGERWYDFPTHVRGNKTMNLGEHSHYFTSILEDDQGNIGVSTLEGVHIFNGVSWKSFDDDFLANDIVLFLKEDREGRIWAGTEFGVSCYENGKWKNYDKSDGLGGKMIYDFFEDSQGNIWVFNASDMKYKGISLFENEQWTTFYKLENFPESTVENILEDENGNVMVFSESSISMFKDGSWYQFTEADGLIGSKPEIIFKDRNDILWIVSDEGIFIYKGPKWEQKLDANAYHNWSPELLFEDRQGNIWLGTDKSGALMYDGSVWHQYTIKDGLADDKIESFFEDNERKRLGRYPQRHIKIFRENRLYNFAILTSTVISIDSEILSVTALALLRDSLPVKY